MNLLSLILFLLDPPDVHPSGGSTNAATFSLRSLAFDPVTNAIGYRIYVTPIVQGQPLTIATNFFTTNTTNVIPHLNYGQVYWIQSQTITATTNSYLLTTFIWPQPLTNVDTTTVLASTNLNTWTATGQAVSVTNAPGTANFYRLVGVRTNNIDPYQVRE